MPRHKDELLAFAKRIESAIKVSKGFGMENLICRLLTSKDTKVSSVLAARWVEWRYGKPTERHEHTGADGSPLAITVEFVKANGDSGAETNSEVSREA